MITDPTVDAVLVASSEATHEKFVLACLEAGKPVLCEKPLAPSAAECLRVVQAEATLGRRLVQVGFMRRFDPSYMVMKQVLDSGRIGDALFLHCIHRNADYPTRYDSDALVTATGVHDIDIARWLLGREIVSVTAHTLKPSSLVRSGFVAPAFRLPAAFFTVLYQALVMPIRGHRCSLRSGWSHGGTADLPGGRGIVVDVGDT